MFNWSHIAIIFWPVKRNVHCFKKLHHRYIHMTKGMGVLKDELLFVKNIQNEFVNHLLHMFGRVDLLMCQ